MPHPAIPMPVPTPSDLPPLATLRPWVDKAREALVVVGGDVVAAGLAAMKRGTVTVPAAEPRAARVALVGGPKIQNTTDLLEDIRGRD